MKSLILFSLIFAMIVCPYAAEEKFEVQLDANGSNTDHDDFGWKILLVDGSVDQDCHVKLFSVSDRAVYFEGDVKAGQKFPINTRTSSMGLEITNGTPNSLANCVVQWKLSKAGELFNIAMRSNKKGVARYNSVVSAEQGASIRINNFMASHDCTIKIKSDKQMCFYQKIRGGKIYEVNTMSEKDMRIMVKDAPANRNVRLSLDVEMVGQAMFRTSQEEVDEDVLGVLGLEDDEKLYTVKFSQQTDETGCVHSDPYNISPKGVRPQIRLLVVNQKFKDVVLKINDINLRPEFGITINGRHFYRVGFGLKSGDDLALGLVAEGGKPLCTTSFAFICENFVEETE